jgi:uncharacterized cupin superfamily protein
MPQIIKLKRRVAGNLSGAPTGLAVGEPAYSEVDSILYIGLQSGSVQAIGGIGSFCTLTGTQTISGAKTFTGGVTFSTTASTFSAAVNLGASATATTPTTSDNSTAVATTAWVRLQTYLTANQSIAVSGDVTGSGTTAITATIAAAAVTNAKLANVATSTIKGRATAGTGSPEDLTASQVKTILAIVPGDITGFNTAVQTNPLNTHATATANYNMGGFTLTSVAEPTNAQDVATKNYVDNMSVGLEFKASVKVATTANITLSGTQTIDGIAVVAGDRVLVKNQTTQAQNGIYLCAAGSWTRTTDANSSTTLVTGSFVYIDQGSTLAGTAWVMSATGTITVGTTNVIFTQFAGSGAGTGSTTITTLGTIVTGTWNATTIGVAYGGTGATTLTGLIKGNGTSAFTAAVLDSDYLNPSSTIDGGTF